MLIPSVCPKCNRHFKLNYLYIGSKPVLISSCSQINHHISFSGPESSQSAHTLIITINLTQQVNAHFDFTINSLTIHSKSLVTKIPFFLPNLSDYGCLIKKLNTYLIFS